MFRSWMNLMASHRLGSNFKREEHLLATMRLRCATVSTCMVYFTRQRRLEFHLSQPFLRGSQNVTQHLCISYPKQSRLIVRNTPEADFINHTKATFAKPAISMSPPTNKRLPATSVSTGLSVVFRMSRTVSMACSMLRST